MTVVERLIAYGAQRWLTGWCEVVGSSGYCPRRARWMFEGKLYCGACIRERLSELVR